MPHFVIRAEDLSLLNELPDDGWKLQSLEWINRGTNQRLKSSSVDMLIRTLYSARPLSQSVRQLHSAAGVRLHFHSVDERERFARQFRRIQRERVTPSNVTLA